MDEEPVTCLRFLNWKQSLGDQNLYILVGLDNGLLFLLQVNGLKEGEMEKNTPLRNHG